MEHILVVLVEDKPGVLNRVASMFRRRAMNIKSLNVGHSSQPGVSQLTVVIDAENETVERVVANLYKLINVIQVKDLTQIPHVSRNLAMLKVATTASNRGEIIQLVEIFRARIVDTSLNSLIVEITGSDEKIDSFLLVLEPFGIIEMVRTDIVAMTRGMDPLFETRQNENEQFVVEEILEEELMVSVGG
ncbi:MAG: acetolactate synthase small subunit [Anaerolineaceae bacterium]|nr:acetolactate synthase small subunit [Anaerolineaceae bacterium]